MTASVRGLKKYSWIENDPFGGSFSILRWGCETGIVLYTKEQAIEYCRTRNDNQ